LAKQMASRTFRNRLGDLVEIPEVAAKLVGLLERMQTPAAKKAMASANASPKALGRAAKAARRP